MIIAHLSQGKGLGTRIVGPAATGDPSTLTTRVSAAAAAAVATLARAASSKAACSGVTAAPYGESTSETVEPR